MKTRLLLLTLLASSCSAPFEDGSDEPDGQAMAAVHDAAADAAEPEQAASEAGLTAVDGGAGSGPSDGAAQDAVADARSCRVPDVHPLDLPASWLPTFTFVDESGGCTHDHPDYSNDSCSLRWTLHQVGAHVTVQPESDPACDGHLRLQACEQGIIAQAYCPLNYEYRVWIYSVEFDLEREGDGYVPVNVVTDASCYSGSGGVAPCARQATPEETCEVLMPQVEALFEGLSWPCGPEN